MVDAVRARVAESGPRAFPQRAPAVVRAPALCAWRARRRWARGRHLQAGGSCLLTSATPMLSPVQTAPTREGQIQGGAALG